MVRYANPEMFYLFIPFCLIIVWYFYQGKKIRLSLDSLGSPSVNKYLLNRFLFSNIYLRSRLKIIAIIFILFASTGPQIGLKLTEMSKEGVDIFIMLDTSNSMNAIDVKPSRIEKAKYELRRVLNNISGD